MTVVWAVEILNQMMAEGSITSDIGFNRILQALQDLRSNVAKLIILSWISVPMAFPQVIAICCLLSNHLLCEYH